MILPDVNVLIYALRKDAPHHAVSNGWLNGILNSDVRFGISPPVLAAVVRIATDRRIFAMPSDLAETFAFAEFLLAQPTCQTVEPGERHWDIFKRLCIETDTRGPRITDAWYAALAIEWGCEWITFDRDFARFPGLRWRLPSLD